MAKKTKMFGVDDLRKEPKTDVPLPVDGSVDNIQRMSEYAEIPLTRLRNYKKRDQRDIIDKDDPEYKALVESISQHGVYDAIIVRPIRDDSIPDDEPIYEILAGHHRVSASKDAGKRNIPARVTEYDDNDAEDVYRITNLLRRKQSIRDLAYGWWHYFRATRYKTPEEIQEMISQGSVSKSLDLISESKGNRQLYRYAALHNLTDEMLDLIEKKNMSIKFGVEISYIDQEKQNDLLEYKANLKSLDKAKRLRALAEGEIEGEVWSKESIQKILYPNPLPSEKANKEASDKDFIASLKSYIPKHFHEPEAMLGLIEEALDMYFKQHPEKQIEP